MICEKIVSILEDGPFTLKDLVKKVMDSGYEPPGRHAVVSTVSQALYSLKQRGLVQAEKNSSGKNQYSLRK